MDESPRAAAELAMYLLVAGMAVAAAGVTTAMALFIANGHTTTDVCNAIDGRRSRICERGGSVRVSLPTLSYTAVLSPERWYFVYGLSTAAILLGVAYACMSRVFAWHVAAQARRRRGRKAAEDGRVGGADAEGDADAEAEGDRDDDDDEVGCSLSCAAIGWPFCWVRPRGLCRALPALGVSSAVLLFLTAAITLQHHVIAHGAVAGLMFASAIAQLCVAMAIQSHTSRDDALASGRPRADGGDDAFRIPERARARLAAQLRLKRRVALSLVATGALAVASNVALYSADWVSAEQLSETTGPVLQYVTIAHMVVGHLSYLMDMRAYRGFLGGSPPTGAPSRSGV